MICPNCGAEVKRRPVGSGTQIDPTTPLGYTESNVWIEVSNHPELSLDVRGWQNQLIKNRDIRKNYHQVQAALSTLVGRGMINMDVSGFPPRYYKP